SQTQVAQREAQRANAVRDLLVELFENESPGGARASLPDTATLLQRGAERARTDLFTTPALQVEMLVTVARVYDQLSQYDQARPLLTQALAIARRLPAEDEDTLIDALAQLGQLELSQKHYDKALPFFDEALLLQRSRYPQGLTTASLLQQRGLLYSETDRHTEAIADYQASLAIRQKRLDPRNPLLIRSYGALGTAHAVARQHGQAMPWLQRALALSRQVHGDVHDETARRLSNMTISLIQLDRVEEAERAAAEAVAISNKVYAAPNSAVASRYHNLGTTQLLLGRLDDAETSLRESIAIERAIGPEEVPGIGFSNAKLARLQEWRGDLKGALALARESERVLSSKLSPNHRLRLDAELRTLRLRLMQGDSGDLRASAAALRQRVNAMAEPDPSLGATALYVQGLAYARAGSDAEAAGAIEQALRAMQDSPFPHDTLAWFATLAQVRERLSDTAGAASALREAEIYAERRHVPASHPARRALTHMQTARRHRLRI
ncbi:MAG: tetratricopeptide repeat protein, partial [Pseudoxanthomonas sp.]